MPNRDQQQEIIDQTAMLDPRPKIGRIDGPQREGHDQAENEGVADNLDIGDLVTRCALPDATRADRVTGGQRHISGDGHSGQRNNFDRTWRAAAIPG